jgi:hypothetical protein
MNLHEKLIEVRKCVPYLQKENQGEQYKYVSSSQVLGNIKSKLDELKILLVPSVKGHSVSTSSIEFFDAKDHISKRTNTYFTELDMSMAWVNAEKPDEKIECAWYGQGVDIAGEKGVGKALTYAEKYFILKFFNIPTDKDDPDSFQRRMDDEDPPQQKDKHDYPECLSGKPERDDKNDSAHICHDCGNEIKETKKKTLEQILADGAKYHKLELCQPCLNIRYKAAHPDA